MERRGLSPTLRTVMAALIERGSIPITAVDGASTAAVYKYLDRLESIRVRNVHGTLHLTVESEDEPQTAIGRRCRFNKRLKAGVATYIVEQLAKDQESGNPCGPLFLDYGSACVEVGRRMVERRAPDCRVLTTNPLVFPFFASEPAFKNLWALLGAIDWDRGAIDCRSDELRSTQIDTAIIGTDRVFSNGILGFGIPQGFELKRDAIRNARRIFCPVDQSKLFPATAIEHNSPLTLQASGMNVQIVVGVDPPVPLNIVSLVNELRANVPALTVVAVSPSGRIVEISEPASSLRDSAKQSAGTAANGARAIGSKRRKVLAPRR